MAGSHALTTAAVAVAAALAGFGGERGTSDRCDAIGGTRTAPGESAALGDMPEERLLDAMTALLTAQRAVDALRVAIAGEVALRSGAADGLAGSRGFRSAADLIAAAWRIPSAQARRLCTLGAATRPSTTSSGEIIPPANPVIGDAITAGSIGIDAAEVIVRHLNEASPQTLATDLVDAESLLAGRADALTFAEVGTLPRQVRDGLDERGAESRDELRRTRRSFTLASTSEGMTRAVWLMPPETAGLVKAAIDAVVSRDLRRARDAARPADGSTRSGPTHDGPTQVIDERTLPQLRADAASRLFEHVATCDRERGSLPSITMVVRMTLDQLRSGLGSATVDGIDETISAETARVLAADAEIIPVVLGGAGEVLDLGRSRRLFTRAQRLALAERDSGHGIRCGFGSCPAPPAYTDAHHIRWWDRDHGRTDLANGILLCRYHHQRIHDGGWSIKIRDGIPVFLPPATVRSRVDFRADAPQRREGPDVAA